MGPDPPIRPPKKNESTDEYTQHYAEAVNSLAEMAQVTKETANEAIAARYEAYARDWSTAKEWMKDNAHFATSINLEESKFAKLYSIIISRTANLGPVYQTERNNAAVRGVIPLHDMFNHPPPDVEHNVELVTVGDLRDLMQEEEVQRLVGLVLGHGNANAGDYNKKESSLDNKDVLLVARRQILPGEELFLSYRNNRSRPMIDEKERAWTTLQYGFFVQ